MASMKMVLCAAQKLMAINYRAWRGTRPGR
jgi:hypothetical protein